MADEHETTNPHKLAVLNRILAGPEREPVIGSGELKFNELTGMVEVGGKELPLEDHDVYGYQTRLLDTTQRKSNHPLLIAIPTLRSAILWVAHKDSFHPFFEWSFGLQWDGEDRLSEQLPRAFRQVPGTIQSTFLRLTMRALMARAMIPGCKVDTMLVLVGPQGQNKSRALRVLGGKWFTDQQIDVESKDAGETIHRHWLIEVGELSALRGKDLEKVKAYLSKSDDFFRAPYARAGVMRKRMCVFIGTTNQDDFLVDDTGNRRFWPVVVDDLIDVEWLSMNRGQIFAQALYEIMDTKEKKVWWLSREEQKQHEDLAKTHLQIDPWLDPTKDWLESHKKEGLDGCQLTVVLDGAIGKKVEHWHSGDTRRIACVMSQLGARRVRGEHTRKWFWGQDVMDV